MKTSPVNDIDSISFTGEVLYIVLYYRRCTLDIESKPWEHKRHQ